MTTPRQEPPQILVDKLAELESFWGAPAYNAAVAVRRSKGRPKYDDMLLAGIWLLVEQIQHGLQLNNREACALLSRHAIIDRMNGGAGLFDIGPPELLKSLRVTPQRWQTLHSQGKAVLARIPELCERYEAAREYLIRTLPSSSMYDRLEKMASHIRNARR